MEQPPGPTRSYKQTLAKPQYQGLSKTTVWRRTKGVKPREEAHMAKRVLDDAQELVLVEWTKLWGRQGLPPSRRQIRIRAQKLVGREKRPTDRWLKDFNRRHPDLVFKKSRNLDPKQAACFNQTTTQAHFTDLGRAMEGVKLENMYNGDEIGMQQGGGRKSLPTHFAFDVDDEACVRLRSDNLELVTVIDVVCADGTKLVPGFIMPGSVYFELDWFILPRKLQDDPIIPIPDVL